MRSPEGYRRCVSWTRSKPGARLECLREEFVFMYLGRHMWHKGKKYLTLESNALPHHIPYDLEQLTYALLHSAYSPVAVENLQKRRFILYWRVLATAHIKRWSLAPSP